MKVKKFGWDAMFGIKEDGSIVCIALGSFGENVTERTVSAWGCKEIYHRDPEEMTDEEYKMAYAAHQDMIDSLFRRGHNE